MLAVASRFTTSIAGGIVFAVIATAFFVVFDLNTALGASEGLPVVEIGRASSASDAPTEGSAASDSQDQQAVTEGTASTAVAASAGSSQTPTPGQDRSQSSTPAVAVRTDGSTSQTSSTTREYVEEEVQVNGRRPDPKTEHPGLGKGLLKKSTD